MLIKKKIDFNYIDMIDMFSHYLYSKNISFRNIDDDVIEFVAENLNMLFAIDREDMSYIRILVPKIDSVSELSNEEWINIAEINSNYKVAKIVKIGNDLWITCELFIYYSRYLSEEILFSRMILACKTIYEAYVDYKKQLSK